MTVYGNTCVRDVIITHFHLPYNCTVVLEGGNIVSIVVNVIFTDSCLLKPQPHRIVRFLDRTIGCDWAKVRQIGNVCYDLQQLSHTAIDLYAWSRYHERVENIDGKSHRRKSCD